jgi:predicted nucleic acid-binding protein
MQTFWDTSAVIACIIQEGHSADALAARSQSTVLYAWNWLQVEAEYALLRRRQEEAAWQDWGRIKIQLQWKTIEPNAYDDLLVLNRNLGLRSADAGHLYIFHLLSQQIPDLTLVSFDDEMIAAARKLKLRIWKPARRRK